MSAKHSFWGISIGVVIAVAVAISGNRFYRRWHAQKYIEYQGKYLVRQPTARKTGPGGPPRVPYSERTALAGPASLSMPSEMREPLISMIDSFLTAYASPNADDYVAFRFQETSQPWTMEIDPDRLKQQLPMWPAMLNLADVPQPPVSRFHELLVALRQFHEDDGTVVFCLPCITGWQTGSLSVRSVSTNTIDRGLKEMGRVTSLISKNQSGAPKSTFLAYPKEPAYITAIVSFVVDTVRAKGKDVIVLQAVWLAEDQQWLAVGIGVAPHSGYIAYPF